MSRTFNSFALVVGRILIGAFFLLNGIVFVINLTATTAQFKALGIHGIDALWVVLGAIAVQILGGICIIANWRARPVAIVLALYFIMATILVYGSLTDASVALSYLRNFAIVGALLYLSATN